jgi:hypothetical protein
MGSGIAILIRVTPRVVGRVAARDFDIRPLPLVRLSFGCLDEGLNAFLGGRVVT